MLRLLDWLEESEAKGEWYAIQRRRVLKFAKVKRMDSERGRRRSQRALKRTEVARLLDVWAADPRLVGIRNYALLRLMIYTGLRRAEIVTLRWDDIDLENQTVTVRHGKGDNGASPPLPMPLKRPSAPCWPCGRRKLALTTVSSRP